jgi:hypothetical protein
MHQRLLKLMWLQLFVQLQQFALCAHDAGLICAQLMQNPVASAMQGVFCHTP